jgi:D-lactate dehydrogenase
MRVAVYSTRPYDREFLSRANADHRHELRFLGVRLEAGTAAAAHGCAAVCAFVNDDLGEPVLQALHAQGVRLAGREGEVLRRTLLPCLAYLALGGAAVAAWVAWG